MGFFRNLYEDIKDNRDDFLNTMKGSLYDFKDFCNDAKEDIVYIIKDFMDGF